MQSLFTFTKPTSCLHCTLQTCGPNMTCIYQQLSVLSQCSLPRNNESREKSLEQNTTARKQSCGGTIVSQYATTANIEFRYWPNSVMVYGLGWPFYKTLESCRYFKLDDANKENTLSWMWFFLVVLVPWRWRRWRALLEAFSNWTATYINSIVYIQYPVQ